MSESFHQHTAALQVPTPDTTQPLTIDKTLSKTSLTTFGASETIGCEYTDDQGWNTTEEAVPIVGHNDALESRSSLSASGSTFGSTYDNPANSVI